MLNFCFCFELFPIFCTIQNVYGPKYLLGTRPLPLCVSDFFLNFSRGYEVNQTVLEIFGEQRVDNLDGVWINAPFVKARNQQDNIIVSLYIYTQWRSEVTPKGLVWIIVINMTTGDSCHNYNNWGQLS